MKKVKLVTLILFMGLLAGGCESKSTTQDVPTEVISQVVEETVTNESVAIDGEQQESDSLVDTEKEMFENWVNSPYTYGFMYSDYDNVAEADYGQVFYNGANINETDITAEDRMEYERISGDYFCGDLVVIRKSKMDEFLKKYAGITSDDIQSDFMTYSKKTDCYYSNVTDANGLGNYICTAVKQDGNKYTVKFELYDAWNDGGKIDSATVIFVKKDEGMIISSVKHDNMDMFASIYNKTTKNVEVYGDYKYITFDYETYAYNVTNTIVTTLEDTLLEKHNEYDNFYYFYDENEVCYYRMYCSTNDDEVYGYKRDTAPDDAVYYGDKVKVMVSELDPSVDLLENRDAEKKWLPAVEKTITVDNHCEELRPYDNAETPYDFMSNIKEIIGLKVGDTLESINEGTGGGSLYYQITILEIEHNETINSQDFYE